MFATNVRARPLVSCKGTVYTCIITMYTILPDIKMGEIYKSNVIRHLLHVLHQLPARRAALPGSLCLPFQLHTRGGNRTHIALTLRRDKGNARGLLQVVLRGSISYNTEFQRPLQYKLELRHLPDNYTFMVLEDAMYSVQVCTTSLISARLLGRY